MKDFLFKLESDNLTDKRPFLFGLQNEYEPIYLSKDKLFVYWTYSNIRELMISDKLSIAKKSPVSKNSQYNWIEAFDIKDNKERNDVLLKKALTLPTDMFVTNQEQHNDRKKEILKILKNINEKELKLMLSIKAKDIISSLDNENKIDLKQYATEFVTETMQLLIGNMDRKVIVESYSVYKYFFTHNKNHYRSLLNNQKIIFLVKKLIEKYNNNTQDGALWGEMKSHYQKNNMDFDVFIGDIIAIIGAAMESSIAAITNQMKYCFEEGFHLKNDYQNENLLTRFIHRINMLEPSANYVVRYATENFEYKGQTILTGDKFYLLIPLANRDILEKMESIPDGKSGCHFGRGRHYCIGSDIAEIEIHVALKEIIDKYKNKKVKISWKRNGNIKFRNFAELTMKY